MQVRNVTLGKGNPVRIMGVINLSPESFYKGSIVQDKGSLRARIQEMEMEGATLFDIGGASTAPPNVYSTPAIDVEKEAERVSSMFGIIRDATDHPISIDTTSSKVAKIALDLGADIVNDVSGLREDEQLPNLIAEQDVPVIVMARCKSPCQSKKEAFQSLEESVRIASDAGIDMRKIILDPGIGFGKPPEADLSLLRNLDMFRIFERPILVGISRKAFLGSILKEPNPENRLAGTIAATAIAVMNGADIIRAHDIAEAFAAVRVGESMRIRKYDDSRIQVFHLLDREAASIVLERIGVSSEIITSLSKKALSKQVLLREVPVSAALILKQEMLALGGDAAYHHDTIDHEIDHTDVLLVGSVNQLEKLAQKVSKMRYFGLSDYGRLLQCALEE